ncbi:MAG: dTDP-4-dehydrorhamnose reductase [Cellvibrio sp. 79]|nr:MAG: dTDP-4-dehydrorhamnose reductase [Cellvibrio sp. 79]
MKILVTGASGQIGKHLIPQFANTEHNVIALDHQQLDITDLDKTVQLFKHCQPELTINLAAYTAVDQAEENSEHAFAVNQQGAANISKAADSINAPIIHLSTDYVFSGNKSTPYTENDIPDPINIYGKSKLAGELAVRQFNPRHLILRTAWVFSNESKNFLTTMLRLARQQEIISVVDDQSGGPTYAKHVAQTIVALTNQLADFTAADWGIYHYSGTPYTTWFEFAQAIFQAAQQKHGFTTPQLTPIKSSHYKTPARRPHNSQLSNQKITDRFTIQPGNWRFALEELLTKPTPD